MKKNNPHGFLHMARLYTVGQSVIQSDTKSLDMLIRAAEIGYANAYCKIGIHYQEGIAVEQDMSKTLEFWEVAAKKGSVLGHKLLLKFHGENGDIQTSIRHIKVTASAGDKVAMDMLMNMYKDKLVSKEDLTQTLRAYQTSSNEMKSKDRDDARALLAGQRDARDFMAERRTDV